ncbi:MAG TPA: transcriptional regulator [Bacteroidales bacterium]|nr:transcriptional regulator [Bacteroidales bacterium]
MKTKDYSDYHYKIYKITKLLSHPARVQILDLLMTQGYCKSEDLMNGFPIAFTSVSQHLKEFKETGLIYKKYVDSGMVYALNEEKFNQIKNLIFEFFSKKS